MFCMKGTKMNANNSEEKILQKKLVKVRTSRKMYNTQEKKMNFIHFFLFRPIKTCFPVVLVNFNTFSEFDTKKKVTEIFCSKEFSE